VAFVYVLRCADDSLYVGHTDNLDAREHDHNEGRGSKYTARRRPVRIVYAEEFKSELDAIERERQLKGWTTAKKEALMGGDISRLHSLSRRRRSPRR
jgi:predicted GIY-YIG superfamily endonuclease